MDKDTKAIEDGKGRVQSEASPSHKESPALTIIFQSWATPIIGILMLVLGLLGGYFGRPLITEEGKPTPIVEEASELEENPDISISEGEREAQKAILMDTLVGEIRHFQGEADAPVTIIEFSDFQCSYCGDWSAETGREIRETYVEEGLVRIGYWHFPFLGDPSVMAAEASECAGEQDAFWAYHDYLFGPEVNGKGLSNENLKEFAAALELDTKAFKECLDSGKFSQFVQGQRSIAQQIGVSSTPSFLINGEPLIGAQAFSVFEEVIEAELAGAAE